MKPCYAQIDLPREQTPLDSGTSTSPDSILLISPVLSSLFVSTIWFHSLHCRHVLSKPDERWVQEVLNSYCSSTVYQGGRRGHSYQPQMGKSQGRTQEPLPRLRVHPYTNNAARRMAAWPARLGPETGQCTGLVAEGQSTGVALNQRSHAPLPSSKMKWLTERFSYLLW